MMNPSQAIGRVREVIRRQRSNYPPENVNEKALVLESAWECRERFARGLIRDG